MTYIRKKKSIFVRSVWVMLALFFALLTIVFSVGLSIASDNAAFRQLCNRIIIPRLRSHIGKLHR